MRTRFIEVCGTAVALVAASCQLPNTTAPSCDDDAKLCPHSSPEAISVTCDCRCTIGGGDQTANTFEGSIGHRYVPPEPRRRGHAGCDHRQLTAGTAAYGDGAAASAGISVAPLAGARLAERDCAKSTPPTAISPASTRVPTASTVSPVRDAGTAVEVGSARVEIGTARLELGTGCECADEGSSEAARGTSPKGCVLDASLDTRGCAGDAATWAGGASRIIGSLTGSWWVEALPRTSPARSRTASGFAPRESSTCHWKYRFDGSEARPSDGTLFHAVQEPSGLSVFPERTENAAVLPAGTVPSQRRRPKVDSRPASFTAER